MLGVRVVVCSFFVVQTLAVVSSLDKFQEECQQHCPLQNRTEDIQLDVGCSTDCKINQCLRGCKLWERALEASCQAVCNGTQDLLPPKELYCVMGCNDALNRYLQGLKDQIGTPAAPALVADSLSSTSLRLEWEESSVSNVNYLIQWRYESAATVGADSAWQYCRNLSRDGTTALVESLKPYTNYRFRVVVLLPALVSEHIFSEPSLVIGTRADGEPSSPPDSVRATPADPTRVSVSWKPGPFPNGPILSYVLSIEELPTGYKAHKDIPASENKDFYMFQSLLPSRNYSVSVAMRNAKGLGPAERTVVATPPRSADKEDEKIILLVAGLHTVRSIDAYSLQDTDEYTTENEIRGVAFHVRERLLFVSDSSDRVIGVKLDERRTERTLVSPSKSDLSPFGLSVDWLNDQLYILGKVTDRWQIARCALDGSILTVAVAGLLTKPLHIEVDPYNGYLFWVQPRGGLYRLDLADISNGIKHEKSPELILNNTDLGAFTVDHSNFRILVPSHSQNTVLAVSLDGHEINDIRNNTQSPQFQNVTSLATANGLFYWTDGKILLTEEYNPEKDNYFHNNMRYTDPTNTFIGSIRMNLPSSQPVPVPINPPTGLQAVLGSKVARATWTVPHLLGGQGKGAWQNWSYQLSIQDIGDGDRPREVRDINTTTFVVNNLHPATTYVLRAAAYTSAGVGPWSSPFTGKTLSTGGSEAIILWSGAEGLLMSDPTGHTERTLIGNDILKDEHGDQHITDIAWYKDQLFLVTNRSYIYSYNRTLSELRRISDIDTVGSIAVDWIGKKLYWSNPKQQLITRGNLNGTQQEPLPILTVAKELNVDALHGYIYWSTGHAVESAHLNGKDRKTYYPAELFSGKQVMGLTLDVSAKWIYWIVRNYEGSTLFRAPMAQDLIHGQQITPTKMSILQYPDMRGSLCYFDEHLLWLRNDSNAVVGDLSGRNLAILSGMSLTGLHTVTVIDSSLQSVPDDMHLEDVNVIPEAILNTSLRVEGIYDSFNITWDAVQNVNYGQVFYELKIGQKDKKDIVVETTDSHWSYEDEQLTPYSTLYISARAFTYWGGSPQVTAILHSPPSTPSQPVNPRVYVSHFRRPVKNEQNIKILFRWDPPISPNGVILSYKVDCWLNGSTEFLCQSTSRGGILQYVTRDVPPNVTVYFQVQACTKVGCGVPTTAVRVQSRVENPVPTLLLSAHGMLLMADCDKRENKTLSHSTGGPIIDISYSNQENKIFWIDDNNQIITTRLDKNSLEKNKVVNLNGTGLSIAVDWVGRFLYWSERGDQEGTALIKRLDLNQAENGQLIISTVLNRRNTVYSLQIDPFSSNLYWVEQKQNITTLMKSKSDGSNAQPFFHQRIHRKRALETCNCPENPIVGLPLTIDRWPVGSTQIIWTDASTGNIMSSDPMGCSCRTILEAEINREAGLPPTSITVDHQLIYWSNETEGHVYSMHKSLDKSAKCDKNYARLIEATGIRNIVAFGSHLQSYPDLHCLIPQQSTIQPTMIESTSDSITLELPHPERSPECSSVSLSSIRYTVHYGISVDGNLSCYMDSCGKKETFERILKLMNLKPFTSYVFLISLSNYYSDLAKVKPKTGPKVIFQTAAGAPSPPEDVNVIVLSPNSLQVSWSPPKILNSQTVWYKVLWHSDSSVEGERLKGERIVSDSNNITAVRLDKLIPAQNYTVWVRAYSQNSSTYSESSTVNVSMYPEPENITLVQATAYSLNISWFNHANITDIRHELQYTDSSGEWEPVPLALEYSNQELYLVENLNPKTIYTFRLEILYNEEIEPYIWPHDNRFTFRTLGDKPSTPGVPVMQHLSGDVYQLTWEPSRDNGATIEMYWLEGRKMQEEGGREKRGANFTAAAHYHTPTIISDEWTLYYNGTDNYWIITDLDTNDKYQFRVRSKNSYGWSDYSKESSYFDLTTAYLQAEKQEMTLIIWILTPAAIVLTMLTFMCVFYRHEKEKKAIQMNSSMPTTVTRLGNTDVELATLRELPRRSNFIQNSNALYTGADCILNTDISTLPHLRRDQITLTKFLGSGAFGEVFEGKARSLPISEESEIRVAIKTLRKGATEQEKGEFLKEAQLMSNFKHPHILQLLGVCLDNDPNFIIMELMEGGDLLSYLRSSRPVMSTDTSLTLLDLLSMSVDVARGCCYLEEMHFVHRDLACRNCLVSSIDPVTRIVKIGDFGLARDIYKNDYYRKEGEGLLPVRWMAPESLVDGVFTSQSDVWAFGVLVWEIMALGQQPYPARNNLEVLHYVRNGGRLGQPVNSTPDMYELMLKCWSFNPDERPTFRYCLDVLEQLKANCSNTFVHSSSNSSSIRRSDMDNRTTGSVPKYLELIYDDGSGYEIPRSLEPEQVQEQRVEEDVSSLEKLLPGANLESGVAYTNVTVAVTSEVTS